MTSSEIKEAFDRCEGEFLKFDRIPVADRHHSRRDICGMILLDELFPGYRNMVDAAEHDVIYFAAEVSQQDELTDDHVSYLLRCGISWDDEQECFFSFV